MLSTLPAVVIEIRAEGPFEEWKRRLPKGDRIVNTLCAFANGEGGTLWIGIGDTGEVLGVADPQAVVAALTELARHHCEPPVELTTVVVADSGRALVRADVRAAGVRPVAVIAAGVEPIVYVREDSHTRRATSGEARALASMGAKPRIDAAARRVLQAVAALGDPTWSEAARKAGSGPKAFKRALMPLVRGGLVLEKSGKRLWLTPRGHAQLKP